MMMNVACDDMGCFRRGELWENGGVCGLCVCVRLCVCADMG